MRILEHYQPPKPQESGLLSVIVAAYNIEACIEKGIRSICGQTCPALEIIVVDDGSTDDTGKICDALAREDGRVRVVHQENGGLARARNVGLACARGEYIGFVDGDDWIDADMYERLLGAMTDQRADVAICRYRQISRTASLDGSTDRAVLFEGQEALTCYVEEREEYVIQNAAWNKLYRREILEGLSFPEGKWYEDIVFTTHVLARAGRCIYLDTALYNYIIDREGSIMNQRITSRTFTDQIPAYYEKTKFLQSLGREDLALTHDYFFYKRLLLFYAQIRAEEVCRQSGARIARRAGKENLPGSIGKTEKTRDYAEGGKYLAQLEELLGRDRQRVTEAFGVQAATPRDRKKLKLFYRSPAAYCRRLRWEEQMIIPLKVYVKRILRPRSGSRS